MSWHLLSQFSSFHLKLKRYSCVSILKICVLYQRLERGVLVVTYPQFHAKVVHHEYNNEHMKVFTMKNFRFFVRRCVMKQILTFPIPLFNNNRQSILIIDRYFIHFIYRRRQRQRRRDCYRSISKGVGLL